MHRVREIPVVLLACVLGAACSREQLPVTDRPAGVATTVEPDATRSPDTEPSGAESEVDDPSLIPSSSATAPLTPAATVLTESFPPSGDPIDAGTDVPVVFVGGDESPWVPLGWWDGAAWNGLGLGEAGEGRGVLVSTQRAVGVASFELPGGAIDGQLVPLGAPRPNEYCTGGFEGPRIEIDGESLGRGLRAVAVGGSWPLQPRRVTQVGVDAELYQELGEQVADAGGPVDPEQGDVVQVVRSDLDGDGVEEVLVTFERAADPVFGAVGDFSIVVARHVDGGSVVDQVVFEHYAAGDGGIPRAGLGRVVAIADLNGNGAMEVVIASNYWDERRAEVFAMVQGRLFPVMSGGCAT